MNSVIVSSLLILLFCFIGSLPPSNTLFDIIVDPRWIVDGGSSFRDVSSACIIDSALENFKSFESVGQRFGNQVQSALNQNLIF